MIHILGDGKRKGRFNPDLGHQLNREFEEEARRGRLEEKLEGEEAEERVQKRGEERKITEEIIKSAGIKDIYRGLATWLDFECSGNKIPTDQVSQYGPVSKEQITALSKVLVDFTEYDKLKIYAANYLSALIMANKKNSLTLDFRPLNAKGIVLDYVGILLKNDKRIIYILGDVGDMLGWGAREANFVVDSSAGKDVGYKAEKCWFFIRGKYQRAREIGQECRFYENEKCEWKRVWPK